jgi:SAM-dependent methyltransferase
MSKSFIFRGIGYVKNKALSKVYAHLPTRKPEEHYSKISEILAKPEAPSFYDSEEVFEQLQNVYSIPEYKYDSFSVWTRGMERARQLMQITDLQEPSGKILEAGSGDGMTGYALSTFGHHVTLADGEDWRDNRAKNLPYLQCDLCSTLSLPSDTFDLVYSFNTFEHLNAPEITLSELLRVCKPGGFIHLDFNPVYASPWGLHAYRTMHMPYSQFLFSPDFIDKKLKELSIYDLGKKRTTLQPLNKWRLAQFNELWQQSNCNIIDLHYSEDLSFIDIIAQFPDAFRGLNLTFEDVTTPGICVTLKKQ